MTVFRRKIRAALLMAAALTLLLTMNAAAAESKASISARVEAEVVSSENMPADISFTVTLKAVGEAPLPAATTVTVKKSGKAVFDKIVFTEPGDYFYTLSQVTGSEKYVKYDSEGSYTVMVRVTNDPKAPGDLAAAVSGWRGTPDKKPDEVSKPDSFRFHNTYSKPTKKVTHTTHGKKSSSFGSVKTGDEQNPLMWLILACIAAAGIVILAGKKRGR